MDAVSGMRISDIQTGDRYRKDLGDLTDLVESISSIGMLQPVVVTRAGELLAGHRRLEAAKKLGWESVPIFVAENLEDAIDRLKAERDENTCRKAMTVSELVAIGREIEKLERPKRETVAVRGEGGKLLGSKLTEDRTGTTVGGKSRTDEAVGKAIGLGETTYRRAKRLVEAAETGDEKAIEAVAEMDRTGQVKGPYDRFKGNQKPIRVKPRPGNVVPLGPLRGRIKKPIPDQIENLARSLEAYAMGVDQIEEFDSFTPEQAAEWVRRLNKSLRTLGAFRGRLKEYANNVA